MFRAIFIILLFSSISAYAEKPCEKNFESFLSKFQSDIAYQESHISYPLKYTYIVVADPEPAEKVVIILNPDDRKKEKFPTFPTEDQVKSTPFTKTISKDKNNIYVVNFNVWGTDWSFDYRFAAKSNCWVLIELYDYSV